MHFIVLFFFYIQVCTAFSSNRPRFGKTEEEKHVPDIPKKPDVRIVNGQPAYRGQFPYQAALKLDNLGFCSGSLISSRWLLSAAHCVSGVSEFTIYLGTITLDPLDSSSIVISTRSAIIHKNYNYYTLRNDISVINLSVIVQFTYYIQRVYLPTYYVQNNTFEGEEVLLSGWGKTSSDNIRLSNDLRFIQTTVISNTVCRNVYGSAYVTSSTICASGTGGIGPCSGDSGGALVINDSGYYTQIGIAVFGGTACDNGNPSGYTRVTSYLDWIANNTDIIIQERNNNYIAILPTEYLNKSLQ